MEKCKKETTPYGVALNKVLRTDLIFHLLDYSVSAKKWVSRMLCAEGIVLDTHFKADKISTSKRRIICRTKKYGIKH
jgi:hypothetical protein